MSTIGCLDYDLTRWQQPITFNLELMKLSAYYKKRRDVVAMIEQYDDSKFAKIVVRKDYDDGEYPPKIFKNPKTISGGLVFMKDYVPMDIEIESLVPDKRIYERMKRYYNTNVETQAMFKTLMSAQHARISLDGKTIWNDWEKQLSETEYGKIFSTILHDKSIVNIEGAPQMILEYLNKCHYFGRRLGLKFPLVLSTDEQFNEWSKIKTLVHFSNVKIMKPLSDEQIVNSNFSRAEYVLNNEHWNSHTFFIEDIQHILLQLLFTEAHNKKILLTFTDDFLVSSEWRQVIDLINAFLDYRGTNTIIDFLTIFCYTNRYSKLLKVDKINIFEFVRQNNPELFKLFYECSGVEYNPNTTTFHSEWKWKSNG